MLYHVLVTTKEKHSIGWGYKERIEMNISSKDEIIKNIIVPYRCGQKITVDGFLLKPSKIDEIYVKQSLETTAVLADKANHYGFIPNNLIISHNERDMVRYKQYTDDITDEINKAAEQEIRLNHKECGSKIIGKKKSNTFEPSVKHFQILIPLVTSIIGFVTVTIGFVTAIINNS